MARTILTKKQIDFLDLFSSRKILAEKYYFTGGTALSEFYLKHRYSEDLDFFNEKEEVDTNTIKNFLSDISDRLKLRKIEYRVIMGINTFFLHSSDKETLKIDFSYYPFPLIEKGVQYKNIRVNSLYDIAVNKVHTISVHPRARDFIDLFFIVKKKGYSIQKLIMDAKAKFDWHIDSVHLGSRLLLAKDMSDFPRMIKKIKHKVWQDFFVREAGELGKGIFCK